MRATLRRHGAKMPRRRTPPPIRLDGRSCFVRPDIVHKRFYSYTHVRYLYTRISSYRPCRRAARRAPRRDHDVVFCDIACRSGFRETDVLVKISSRIKILYYNYRTICIITASVLRTRSVDDRRVRGSHPCARVLRRARTSLRVSATFEKYATIT